LIQFRRTQASISQEFYRNEREQKISNCLKRGASSEDLPYLTDKDLQHALKMRLSRNERENLDTLARMQREKHRLRRSNEFPSA
jgi:hypothetical protein